VGADGPINTHSNVNANPSIGDILSWDGTNWISSPNDTTSLQNQITAKVGADGPINTHSNVNANPSIGDALSWDGTNWVHARSAHTQQTYFDAIIWTNTVNNNNTHHWAFSNVFRNTFQTTRNNQRITIFVSMCYEMAHKSVFYIEIDGIETGSSQVSTVAVNGLIPTNNNPGMQNSTFVLSTTITLAGAHNANLAVRWKNTSGGGLPFNFALNRSITVQPDDVGGVSFMRVSVEI
jgi:hypothetical protein